jgi:chromosome segregation ATPase
MTLDASTLVTIAAMVGLPAIVGLVVKAVIERKQITANAANTDATATATVIAAARELVDPLRKELREVREEAYEGVRVERAKVAELRAELQGANQEVRELRTALAEVRAELSRCHKANVEYRARIAQLEGDKAL